MTSLVALTRHHPIHTLTLEVNMNPLSPALSVIVCATARQTWESLSATIGSVQRQSVPATELIIVVDDNPPLLSRATAVYPHLKIIPNTDVRGMSGARHCGVQAAHGNVLAFLEGVETARPNWLNELVSVYNAPYSGGSERSMLIEPMPHRKVS